MKKVFSLTLIFSTLIYSEVNWEREQVCPVPDPTFVNSLITKMSIEEKVGQVIQADLDFIKPSDLRDYPIGSVLNGGNTSPRGKLRASPAEWKSLAQEFYEESKRTGASIPVLWGTDAVHGHSNVFGATIFPHNIGIGAAANPQLVKEIGAAVAEEVLATGLFWTFAPTVTIPQNFRWGRTYEGYSEDPVLVSKLGSAFIEGLQGTEKEFLNDAKILGTAKHFLGDGGTYLGIDQGDTRANEENMRVIHGEPYFASLNSCVRVVMASFNSWNGSKVHGNKYLLTEVLKEKIYENTVYIEPLDQAKEYILMGLRISEGISLSRVEKICDHKIKERNIRYLSDLGLITIDNDRLFVNASGRLVLNQIINKLTEDTFY